MTTLTHINGHKLVRLRDFGTRLFWEREHSQNGQVLVIPVVDDIPLVDKFFHIHSSQIRREWDDTKQPGYGTGYNKQAAE